MASSRASGFDVDRTIGDFFVLGSPTSPTHKRADSTHSRECCFITSPMLSGIAPAHTASAAIATPPGSTPIVGLALLWRQRRGFARLGGWLAIFSGCAVNQATNVAAAILPSLIVRCARRVHKTAPEVDDRARLHIRCNEFGDQIAQAVVQL